MFKQNFHKSFRQLNFSQDHLNFSVQNHIINIYCFEIILKVFNSLLCMTKPPNSLKFIIHGIYKFSSMNTVLADNRFLWKILIFISTRWSALPACTGTSLLPPPQDTGALPLYRSLLHLKMKAPIEKWTPPHFLEKCSPFLRNDS